MFLPHRRGDAELLIRVNLLEHTAAQNYVNVFCMLMVNDGFY